MDYRNVKAIENPLTRDERLSALKENRESSSAVYGGKISITRPRNFKTWFSRGAENHFMSYSREISIREDGRDNRSQPAGSPTDEVTNNVFQPLERRGNFMHVIGEDRPVFIPSVYPVEEPMDETPDNECASVPLYRQSIIVHPLNIEKNRYDTFHNVWPESSPVSAQDLAKAGFKYFGPGDRVKCVFCSGILCGFEEGDIPMEEHRKHFPNCIFVCGQNVNNVPYQRHVATIERSIPARIQSTLVRPSPLQQPKHPQYTSKSERLVTFNEWPSQIRQKPEDMAEAGLFYLGQGDKVKCFFCDGVLHTWDPDDEPWIEHAKWFPNCEFVKVVKGEEFVTKVASGEITSEKPTARKYQDSSDGLDAKTELKDTSQVKALLDNGNTMEDILHALRKLGFQHQGNKLPDVDVIYQTIRNECGRGGTLSRNNSNEYASLEEENRYLKEQRLCKICLENEVSVIFLPCGHVCCCGECSMSVSTCPICRRGIEKRSKAYLA